MSGFLWGVRQTLMLEMCSWSVADFVWLYSSLFFLFLSDQIFHAFVLCMAVSFPTRVLRVCCFCIKWNAWTLWLVKVDLFWTSYIVFFSLFSFIIQGSGHTRLNFLPVASPAGCVYFLKLEVCAWLVIDAKWYSFLLIKLHYSGWYHVYEHGLPFITVTCSCVRSNASSIWWFSDVF